MNREFQQDIFEWDSENWSRALPFWESYLVNFSDKKLECLELGANKGGLSLWLASKGAHVICSDYLNPEEIASALHKKYNLNNRIDYASINALKIPYENQFDLVVFKSILGGISRKNQNELKKEVVEEIYKSLKPGGMMLCAENLCGSLLHRFFRRVFVSWGKDWNYLSLKEMPEIFSSFSQVHSKTVGFLALFGRNELQRKWLGKIDALILPLIPQRSRYIVMIVAIK